MADESDENDCIGECCTSCSGRGTNLSGPCSDCYGTGCSHPQDEADPYDKPILVRQGMFDTGHMHSEPICCFPDCETYLTRAEMAEMRSRETLH